MELNLIHSCTIFRILIAHGSEVDKSNHKGYTPLFHAVKSGSLSVMLELIENGANVNHKNEEYCANHFYDIYGRAYKIKNKTPLFRARSYEVVKLLLQKGANPNMCATVKYGNGEKKHIRAIDHLMKYNPDAARAIFDCCLDVDKESNLIVDFEIFDHHDEKTSEFEGEMELLKKAEKQAFVRSIEDTNSNKLLILHPLLQIFLSLKFKTIKIQFWILLLMQMILVGTLTASGVVFLQFTSCTNLTEGGECFTNRYFQPNDTAPNNTALCSNDNEKSKLEDEGYFVHITNLKCEKSIIMTNDKDKTLAL